LLDTLPIGLYGAVVETMHEEGQMSFCFCRVILPILVIILAWWHVGWAPIALTIIGVLLLILGWKRDVCCCRPKQPAA
jgi:hypothetical protein